MKVVVEPLWLLKGDCGHAPLPQRFYITPKKTIQPTCLTTVVVICFMYVSAMHPKRPLPRLIIKKSPGPSNGVHIPGDLTKGFLSSETTIIVDQQELEVAFKDPIIVNKLGKSCSWFACSFKEIVNQNPAIHSFACASGSKIMGLLNT